MVVLREFREYADDQGNVLRYKGSLPGGVEGAKITALFRGKNNVLEIDDHARIRMLNIRFDCDNGSCRIGANVGVAPFQGILRVGQDARIEIGDNVSTTTAVQISAVEGTTVQIGNDVMIAGSVKLRGDDGHPIFDVRTGARINTAKPIFVGDHVWLGIESILLGGASLGSGSVVGARAIVTKAFPNNCIVAGVPAKIVRTDVAWERPHLSLTPPYFKPDSTTVEKSGHWALTEFEKEAVTTALKPRHGA